MTDDTKAIEALTVEMALTRSEMAALTDAMRLQSIRTEDLTRATDQLRAALEAARARRRSWWRA